MRVCLGKSQPDKALLWACEDLGWQAVQVCQGQALARRLENESFDLLALYACLGGLDGLAVGQRFASCMPLCPPRILLVQPPEWPKPPWADCVAPLCASPQKLTVLLQLLANKPLPKLAAASQARANRASDRFLALVGMSGAYKGRQYAGWLLSRLVQCSFAAEVSLSEMYQACAAAFTTTPGAVERCLRVAVESVFTHGNLAEMERFFGATIDPERGKPTNRAFLLQATQQLRYSLTDAFSPNSMEMHHSPAAPTMV